MIILISTMFRAIFAFLKAVVIVAVGFLVLAALIGAFFWISGRSVKPISPENRAYIGQWGSSTGNRIIIDPEGRGAYYAPNTSIGGAPITIENGQLSLRFLFIGPSFAITMAPTTTSNSTVMVLDHTTYTKLPDNTPLPPQSSDVE